MSAFQRNDLELELFVARFPMSTRFVNNAMPSTMFAYQTQRISNTLARTPPHTHVNRKGHVTGESVCKIFCYILERTSLSL